MVSEDLLKKAVAAFKALSPEQQAEMLEEQRQSWVRGNVGLSRDECGMTSTVMQRPTTVMASELKPCPFCNSDRITVHNIRDGQQAVCKDCGSLGKPVFHGPKGPEATWGEAVAAWNTRPAPAATDTGLVTVLTQSRARRYMEGEGGPWGDWKDGPALTPPPYFQVEERELVTRENATELLAAERAEKEKLEAAWLEAEGIISDLKADNAAQAARIKAETELREDHQKRNKELEAKLAAAEKALEPFSKYAGMLFERNFNNTDIINAFGEHRLTARDFFEARAVLGGKPS